MIQTIRRQIKRITAPDLIGRLRKKTTNRTAGKAGELYLSSYGWRTSMVRGEPLDDSGAPIPWITYPALAALRQVVSPSHRVFEYGCGNSSLWWSKHAWSVVSVEHDAKWADKIRAAAPPNLTVVSRGIDQRSSSPLVDKFFDRNPDLHLSGDSASDAYNGYLCNEFSSYAAEIEMHEPFDVIVVDGMARSLTAWMAGHLVKDGGFIVFDNSDRPEYEAGYAALADLGFGRIDFFGPGPLLTGEWCTSIFCRDMEWSKRARPNGHCPNPANI